jgi:hypothetical protein
MIFHPPNLTLFKGSDPMEKTLGVGGSPKKGSGSGAGQLKIGPDSELG